MSVSNKENPLSEDEKPSDKVPDLGAGSNFIKQADSVANLEKLKQINEGKPPTVPTPEELAKRREKDNKFRKLYTPTPEQVEARKSANANFVNKYTPPSVDDLPEPEESKASKLDPVNLAKLFLQADDKMGKYADHLREQCNCSAENTEVIIEVPGDDNVQLLWCGDIDGVVVKSMCDPTQTSLRQDFKDAEFLAQCDRKLGKPYATVYTPDGPIACDTREMYDKVVAHWAKKLTAGVRKSAVLDTVEISVEELERLEGRDEFLSKLEAAGVDNWEGFDEID